MRHIESPVTEFWRVLSNSATDNGISHQRLARAIGLSRATFYRRVQGDDALPAWDAIERGLRDVGLTKESDWIRTLWEYARDFLKEMAVRPYEGNPDPQQRVHELITLHVSGQNVIAIPRLEAERSWIRQCLHLPGSQRLLADLNLALAAAYGDMGQYERGRDVVREVRSLERQEIGRINEFYARHEEALLSRLLGQANEVVYASKQFTGLLRDYRSAVLDGSITADTLARALRDTARTLVRDRQRWDDARALHQESLELAWRTDTRRDQQLFHTLLDAAMLAALSEDEHSMERHWEAAYTISLTADKYAARWLGERCRSKLWLTRACVLLGRHNWTEGWRIAERWRQRAIENRDAQSAHAAQAIVSAARREDMRTLDIVDVLR